MIHYINHGHLSHSPGAISPLAGSVAASKEWIPTEVKEILEKTAVVKQAADVYHYLQRPETGYILFLLDKTLFVFEKDTAKKNCSLKIFRFSSIEDNPQEFISMRLASNSMITRSALYVLSTQYKQPHHSVWLDGEKMRIDPLFLMYQHIPIKSLPLEWLQQIEIEGDGLETSSSNLLWPLEKHRRPTPPLPKSQDLESYLRRFKTRKRPFDDDTSESWLCKAWLRSIVPLGVYKKFHWLNRAQWILENHTNPTIAHMIDRLIPKLMRSFYKPFLIPSQGELQEKFTYLRTIKRSLLTTSQAPPKDPAPLCLMPSEKPNAQTASEDPAISTTTTCQVMRTQTNTAPSYINRWWDSHITIYQRPAAIGGIPIPTTPQELETWQVPTQKNTLKQLAKGLFPLIEQQYAKNIDPINFFDDSELIRLLIIYQKVLEKLSPTLASLVALYAPSNIHHLPKTLAVSFNITSNPKHYATWQEYYALAQEIFRQVEPSIFDPQLPPTLQQVEKYQHDFPTYQQYRKIQAEIQGNPSPEYVTAAEIKLDKEYLGFLQRRCYQIINSRRMFTTEYALLQSKSPDLIWLIGHIQTLQQQRLDKIEHEPSLLLPVTKFHQESALTRGELFDPLNAIGRTARALPEISPEGALTWYSALDDAEKLDFSYFAQEDLILRFFQETYQVASDLSTLQRNRGQGSLPWVDFLKNSDHKKCLEQFLAREYKKLCIRHETIPELRTYFSFLTLLQLAARCVEQCPDLEIPDFASWPDTIQNGASAYLCWIYLAKNQNEKARKWIPTEQSFLTRWGRLLLPRRRLDYLYNDDMETIVSRLKTLEDPIETPQQQLQMSRIPTIPTPPPKIASPDIDTLQAFWWNDDEPIRLKYIQQPNDILWVQADQPIWQWQQTPPDFQGLPHGNHLVEKKTKAQRHVFYEVYNSKTYAFAISYDSQHGYAPFYLEEHLMLLLQRLRCAQDANSLDEINQALKKMPLMPPALSPLSLELISKIVQRLPELFGQPSLPLFDTLGLSIQIMHRLNAWAANPAFNTYESLQGLIQQQLGLADSLYKEYQQNINPQYALSDLQREDNDRIAIQSFTNKKTKEDKIHIPVNRNDRFSSTIFAVIDVLAKRTKDLINHLHTTKTTVWRRPTQPLFESFENKFRETEYHLLNSHYPWPRDIKYLDPSDIYPPSSMRFFLARFRHMHYCTYLALSSLACRISCIVARQVFGVRIVWKDRVESLEQIHLNEEYFLVPAFSEEILEKRLQLQKTITDPYILSLVDFALEHKIKKGDTETQGAFLARVEQLKYTRNLFQPTFNTLCRIMFYSLRQLTGLLRAGIATTRLASQTHSLRPQKIERPIRPHLPTAFEIFNGAPSAEESTGIIETQAQTSDDILALANTMDIDDRQKGIERSQEEKVAWGHLVGLFLQNQMHRIQEINPHITKQQCLQLDHLMGTFLAQDVRGSNSPPQEYGAWKQDPLARVCLVFEYTSRMYIRKEQVEKLKILLKTKDGQYQNMAVQMVMGAGKTSVLTPILLMLAAKPDRISIFIPPAAQFELLSQTLVHAQKQYFQQEVVPINMSFDLMQDEKNLEWLLARFIQAKQKNHVLLIHPHTFHHLRLMWMSTHDSKQLKLVLQICEILKHHGDALLDEIDLILDPTQEVSMSHGQDQTPTWGYLERFKQLILKHGSNPSLWKSMLANTPETIDFEKYQDFQRTDLSQALGREWGVPENHDQALGAYLIDAPAEQVDPEFLQWLEKQPMEQKDLIAQHKHWFEILRFAIFREHGRHYGRDISSNAVVPYIGVGMPGTTQYSQLSEKIIYYFLTSLTCQIQEKQLKEVIDSLSTQLRTLSNSRAIQKLIVKKFKNATGIDLWLFFFAKTLDESNFKIKEALQLVNNNISYRLGLATYTASQNVHYFSQQITSTSQDLMPMFLSARGFSGTFPPHIEAFNHALYPDPTSDTSVLDAMREHNEPVETPKQLEELFDSLKEDPTFGGIIDTGGLFRHYVNEQVATLILEKLPHIEFVLFFDRDTPKLMKRGVEHHTTYTVGSTEPKILEAWGVRDLSQLFTFYDQRHCEATNVKQAPDRHNALLFGLHTTKRDLLQAVMRLRQYKEQGIHQSITYIILSETAEKLFPGRTSITVEDIIRAAEDNEMKEAKKRTCTSFYHRIDHAFAQCIQNAIQQNPKKANLLQNFLVQQILFSSPYQQFGLPSRNQETKSRFKQYIEAKKKALGKLITPPPSLLQDLKDIQEAFETNLHLPETVKVGTVQKGQEQQQELQQQVEQTLEQVTTVLAKKPPMGSPWIDQENYKTVALFEYYQPKGLFGSSLALVSPAFETKIFQGLFASSNWLHTYNFDTKLNHPDQKKANYFLLERKINREGITTLIPTVLSSFDYLQYKTHPEKLPQESGIFSWLDTEDPFPLRWQGTLELGDHDLPIFEKLKLQLALLNGDARYILTHQSPATKDLIAFLKKRVEYWDLFPSYKSDRWANNSSYGAGIQTLEGRFYTSKQFVPASNKKEHALSLVRFVEQDTNLLYPIR